MYYVKYFSFTLKKNHVGLYIIILCVYQSWTLLSIQSYFYSGFSEYFIHCSGFSVFYLSLLWSHFMFHLHVLLSFHYTFNFFSFRLQLHNIHCVCCSSFTMPMASPCSSENSNHVGQNMGSWLTSHAINNTIKVLILFIISLY